MLRTGGEVSELMEITFTTPFILFPAVSLLLLAYTNRYLALASIIRSLHSRYQVETSSVVSRQINNLQRRLRWIRATQAYGVLSLIACLISVVCLFFDLRVAGVVLFGISLILMVVSLVYCLLEILISGRALEIELEGIQGR